MPGGLGLARFCKLSVDSLISQAQGLSWVVWSLALVWLEQVHSVSHTRVWESNKESGCQVYLISCSNRKTDLPSAMALGSKRTFLKILKYIKKCKPNLKNVFTKHISDKGSLSRTYNGFQFYKIKTENLLKRKICRK